MHRYSIPVAGALMALMPVWGGAAPAAAPPGGTISLEPRTGDGDYDGAMPAFVSAASDALATKGFTILEDPGHAAYVGELILSREQIGTEAAKVPAGSATAGPGGAGGTVGVGARIPLSSGATVQVPLLRTRLELRIRKRGGDGIVWDGAAVTVRAARTKKGANDVVAADLSEALLQGYPAVPDGVVGVP